MTEHSSEIGQSTASSSSSSYSVVTGQLDNKSSPKTPVVSQSPKSPDIKEVNNLIRKGKQSMEAAKKKSGVFSSSGERDAALSEAYACFSKAEEIANAALTDGSSDLGKKILGNIAPYLAKIHKLLYKKLEHAAEYCLLAAVLTADSDQEASKKHLEKFKKYVKKSLDGFINLDTTVTKKIIAILIENIKAYKDKFNAATKVKPSSASYFAECVSNLYKILSHYQNGPEKTASLERAREYEEKAKTHKNREAKSTIKRHLGPQASFSAESGSTESGDEVSASSLHSSSVGSQTPEHSSSRGSPFTETDDVPTFSSLNPEYSSSSSSSSAAVAVESSRGKVDTPTSAPSFSS